MRREEADGISVIIRLGRSSRNLTSINDEDARTPRVLACMQNVDKVANQDLQSGLFEAFSRRRCPGTVSYTHLTLPTILLV